MNRIEPNHKTTRILPYCMNSTDPLNYKTTSLFSFAVEIVCRAGDVCPCILVVHLPDQWTVDRYGLELTSCRLQRQQVRSFFRSELHVNLAKLETIEENKERTREQGSVILKFSQKLTILHLGFLCVN